jgi:cobalt/nickel transport protein
MPNATQKWAILALAAAAALVAGVGSYFAYSKPDALEHSVAVYAPEGGGVQSTDAAHKAPLADYAVPGVAKPAVSGGLAGLIGVAVTFVVIMAAGFALSRASRKGRDSNG